MGKLGVRVVIGAHNTTKGIAAAKNITAVTGTQVDSLGLDLGSKTSVRDFANRFLDNYSELHFLINDAGIAFPSYKTRDGFESVFEVDYLGHFLLTELLLPILRDSRPSRIVNVASSAHENACAGACWPKNCFEDWTYIPTPVVDSCNASVFTPGPTYGAAKFLMIMHAKALAKREGEDGVQAFSINPGFVLTEAMHGFDPNNPRTKLSCMAQSHPPGLPPQQCPFNPAEGAAAIAYALTSTDAVSGEYYDRLMACEKKEIVRHGFTDAMILELYNKSLAWALPSTNQLMV